MAKRPSTPKPQPRRARVRIGLGSWADDEYVGLLYPKDLPAKDRLRHYATWFDQVEVNSGYYRTPQRQAVAAWVSETPTDFSFDLRLHRALSEDPEAKAREGDLVARLLDGTRPLAEANKLGAFLLVLPARFDPARRRLEELDALVEKLAGHRLAVELRNRGWIDDEWRERTFDYFRSRKLVWVAVDMPRIDGSTIMPAIDEVTNPHLAYLRLHGRNQDWLKSKTAAERHTHEYARNELKEIAVRVRALAEKADEVHVVANNHAQDFAPKAAIGLKRVLGLSKGPVTDA